MKNIALFAAAFGFAFPAFGQTTDTTFISISQENAPLEKQLLMDSYDQVFSTLEPTRWLFALNFAALSGSQNDLVRASTELKIIPALSLHGSYGFGHAYAPASPYESAVTTVSHRLALQPRWYYAMPRRIRQSKSANNMSGNYIGLEAVCVRTNSNIGSTLVEGEQRSLALRYGLQRRLFRYGFLDIGFGVGVMKEQRSTWQMAFKDTWHLFANSQVGLGLALARPKSAVSAGGYCDVLRCFREERQMWKIDLYNLIRINSFDDYKGQVSVEYERKIGTSPFSLVALGEWSHTYLYAVEASRLVEPYLRHIILKNNSYRGVLQSRYYYSQAQRIARGKSGNNLSGVYLGAQLHWQGMRDHTHSYQCTFAFCPTFNEYMTTQSKGLGLLWGIQHRLFQHGFIDFQIVGAQAWVQTKSDPLPADRPATSAYLEFTTTFKLRAGLAF